MEDMNQFMIDIGRQWSELMLPQTYLASTVTDFVKNRNECKNTPLYKYFTIMPLILTKPGDSLIFIYNLDVEWNNEQNTKEGGIIKDVTAKFPFEIGYLFESSNSEHSNGRYEFVGFGYSKKKDSIYLKTAVKLGPPEKEKAGVLTGLEKFVSI